LGSPYGPVFEPFTAYNFPGYYGLGTRFWRSDSPSSYK
jgi:hypothetical protein